MVAKMHRMHLPKVGEGVIYSGGGVPYEADAVPLYAPGSYMRIGNKEFIYAIASGTLKTDRGAKNSLSQKVSFRVLAVKIEAGDKTVSILVASGLAIAEDELKGGEIVVFGPDNACFTRGILGNNVILTGDGGTLVVQIDSPAPKDFAVTEHAECMANPYSAVNETNNEWTPVMGIPTVEATDGQGLWLQVTGPGWVSPVTGVGGPGGAINLIEVEFNSDGSICVAGGAGKQRAGSQVATGGGESGAPFINFAIAH